tara:strand:- start:482 stop:952 length:471 start_codon:yes stop_codon:yes gene_type:complete
VRRDIVFDIIKNTPGVSYNEIGREANLSNGVVSHYLIKLMESGEVEKEGTIRGKYFLKNIPKKDRVIITLLRNKTNNEIFKFLMKNFNDEKVVTQNEISKKITKSASTISVSLKSLQRNNIIERVIMSKNLKNSSDLGYKILNGKLSANYIIKYNL